MTPRTLVVLGCLAAAAAPAGAGTGDGESTRRKGATLAAPGTGVGRDVRTEVAGTGAGAAGTRAGPGARRDPREILAELRRRRGADAPPATPPRATARRARAASRPAPPAGMTGAGGTEVPFELGAAVAYARENSFLREKLALEQAARSKAAAATSAHPAMELYLAHVREKDRSEHWFKEEPFFGIRQPFDLFGNRRAARRVADRDVELAGLARTGFDQQLEYDVLRAYRALQYRLASASAAAFSEKLAVRFLEVARLRNEAGTVPELDVIRGEAELYKARAAKRQAEQDVVEARARLGAVMGYEDWRRLGVVGRLPGFRIEADAAEVLARGLERRVDLKSFEVLANRFQAEIQVHRQKRRPVVSATFDMKQDPGRETSEFGGLRVDLAPVWYGKIHREVEEKKLMKQAVEAERRHFVRLMKIRLGELLQSVDLVRQRLNIMQYKEIPENARQLEAVERGYRAGGLDNLAVLNAQRTVIEVVGRYLAALNEYHQVRIELRKEAGMAPLEAVDLDISHYVEDWIFAGGL